jgi:predicted phosphoribosyltransferase
MSRFIDRFSAGKLLASRLVGYRGRGAIVLGIPRGGVEVAAVVARELNAPLDFVVAKKVPYPANAEVAVGAVSHGGAKVINPDLELTGLETAVFAQQARLVEASLATRRTELVGKKRLASLAGKIVIVVDDGVATGSTAVAAIKFIRLKKPAKIVVATPVAPPAAVEFLRKHADEVHVLLEPPFFHAVGQFYEKFPQLTDEQVRKMLAPAGKKKVASPSLRP